MRKHFLFLGLIAVCSAASGQESNPVPNLGMPVIPEGGTLSCEAPKSPLYQKKDVNDAVNVKLMATFPIQKRGYAYGRPPIQDTRGVVAIENENGALEYSPVLITSRGKSRGSACEAPPLRMKFVDSDTRKTIEQTLQSEGLVVGTDEYMKRYYDLFIAATLDPAKQAKVNGRGMFGKLGDDIKIVTHCGKATWHVVGGDTVAAQDEKLLSEYYLYQILDHLQTTVESTRLARITYINKDGNLIYAHKDAEGNQINYRMAFFREPPTSLAKRCKLLTKAPVFSLSANQTSKFQIEFINKFAFNSDFYYSGHNVNILFDSKGEKYFGPYDFDLSGIFTDNYNPASLTVNLQALTSLFKSGDPKITVPFVKKTVELRPKMQKVIDDAMLSSQRKDRFQKWFTLYMDELTKTLQPPQSN